MIDTANAVNSPSDALEQRRPLIFVLLVFALTVPFWAITSFTDVQLLPGIPLSGLAAVCPAIAAAILVYRDRKRAGLAALLRRAFDYDRIDAKVWYAPALLLQPAILLLAYASMSLTGVTLPVWHFPFLAAPIMFAAFFFSSLAEELGWSGYAIDPLQQRWGALRAAIVLGAVWAIWHYIALVQAHRSFEWIAWWSLGTVASRVIIVWLYNNTGKSVFVTTLHHAAVDVSWQLFPNFGSHYDPAYAAPITAIVAVTVTLLWGAQTLSQFRYAPKRN